jgi:hypothetical protein
LLTNESYVPGENGLTFTSLENISLRVPLPPWLEAAECFSIGHDGIKPISVRKSRSAAKIEIARMDLTKMIVFAKRGVRRQIENRQSAIIEKSARDVAFAESELEKLLASYEKARKTWDQRGILCQSGFEIAEDMDWLGGWVIRDGAELDGLRSRTGQFSVRCDKEQRGIYSGSFDVRPGWKIRVRSHFLIEGPKRGEHFVFIRYLNEERQEISRESTRKSSDSSEWVDAEAVFLAPDGAVKSQIFWGVSSGNGPLWVDDVLVEQIRQD